MFQRLEKFCGDAGDRWRIEEAAGHAEELEETIDLIASGVIDPEKYVTEVLQLDELQHTFARQTDLNDPMVNSEDRSERGALSIFLAVQNGEGFLIFLAQAGAGDVVGGAEGESGLVAVVQKIGALDGGGDGIVTQGAHVIEIICAWCVGEQAQGVDNSWRKIVREVVQGEVCVLDDVVEQGDNGCELVGHLFSEMDGVEDVGDATFVELAVMGVIGEKHGFLSEWGVDHDGPPRGLMIDNIIINGRKVVFKNL